MKHLAIFQGNAITDILSGKKAIEGRFSQIKIAPYGKVSAGDMVMMKSPGGPLVGEFVVDRVLYFDHPKKEEAEEIKRKYKSGLKLDEDFWWKKEKICYASLIFIRQASRYLTPPTIVKKRDLRGWVVLG
ncbi:hypothetical protein A2Z23_01765 [Candidatus Curtissbacteria bacterium RBG_16_39_7]|uniref:ASCH domain-containing protein n=1 Tax=Candidatus Curtissbacteria bacterium RBG_16_39_7 TaxID=1797707 RepID=A0A1F5G2A6_9BACT|nr:MAG: hypothetical protein A2Z23_01765 [Candidatus Curtissbacteria bacterium RBG_16_39_7]